MKKIKRDHARDCECLDSGVGERFDCTCNYDNYVKLDEMIEAMQYENRLDNNFVISEGVLRDYIEKYFFKK
jgi:hypothetical protein